MADTLTELGKVQAEYEKAQRRHAEAQRRAEQAAAAHEAAVQQRRDETARHVLESYDEVASQEEVAEAEQRLADAVLNDKVWSAVAAVYAARLRRYHQAVAVDTAAQRLGDTSRPNTVTSPAAPAGIADILRIVERRAAAVAADEHDALEQARERYAQTGEHEE